MPDPMTAFYEGPPRAEGVEVITSVQRRRRWSTEEKVRIVEETNLPGNSVSLVARRHGIAGNQLFTWRRLMAQGAFTAAGAGEEVVPASKYRAAQQQIRTTAIDRDDQHPIRSSGAGGAGRLRPRGQRKNYNAKNKCHSIHNDPANFK